MEKAVEGAIGKSVEESDYYRTFIGPGDKYDQFAAMQFNLLTHLGLREGNTLLDVGCGSLRAGRLFIPYLLPEMYHGLEPVEWLINEGVKCQIGEDMVRIKKPVFSHDENFTLTVFQKKFDYIIAQSVFSHATKEQIRRCLHEARQVMTPTTIFAATFAEGAEDYAGDKWALWATYAMETIKELADEAGLVCRPLDWPHPDLQRWVLFVTQDFEGTIPDLSGGENLMLVKKESEFCKERLAKIENHPYVVIGFKISRLMRLVGFGINNAMRWFRCDK
ncbi:MAG: hypothetical protein OEV28_00310 [Nitrospirota bacterium]|nr:hypothetical protein [Nitrospirota bacterium]